MATSAGFFGLTAHGPTNGLAATTLSIFNMDHPRDQAWFRKCFETVCPDGELQKSAVNDLLRCFYHQRPEGPTMSGSYLQPFPPHEMDFICGLFSAARPSLRYEELLDELCATQEHSASPTPAVEYSSNQTLRTDKTKHTRAVLAPQQVSRAPMTTAQEIGWEAGTATGEQAMHHPFHLRTSANTQFQDAVEKHTWGRSIGGEFSKFASKKLVSNGGFGMGI